VALGCFAENEERWFLVALVLEFDQISLFSSLKLCKQDFGEAF
jgi:hypothetical protein